MGSMAKSALGQRIIAGLQQIVDDPNTPPKKRRDAAKKLADWKAAAA